MLSVNKNKTKFAPKMSRRVKESVPVDSPAIFEVLAPVLDNPEPESITKNPAAELVIEPSKVVARAKIVVMPRVNVEVPRTAVVEEDSMDDDLVQTAVKRQKRLVEGEEVESTSISSLITAKFSTKNTSSMHIKLVEMRSLAKKARAAKSNALNAKEVEENQRAEIEDAEMNKVDENVVDIVAEGPRIRIVNGSVELDQNSLFVQQPVDEDVAEMEIVDETMSKPMNSNSFRAPQSRWKWTPQLTDLFFKGLNFFGTDFTMIGLFINCQYDENPLSDLISRKHIKLKFKSEERSSSCTVTSAILNRKVASVSIYGKMTAFMKTKKEAEELYLNPEPINDTEVIDGDFNLDDIIIDEAPKENLVKKPEEATELADLVDDDVDFNSAPVFNMDDEIAPFWYVFCVYI